jgi:hypothetical protein
METIQRFFAPFSGNGNDSGAWDQKLSHEISGIELPIQPLHTNIAYWKIQEGL